MRVLIAFIAVALLAAPSSDAFAQRGSAAPRITVQSLEPLPPSAGQQRFRVTLLIDNQNTESLRVRGIDFKLRLANEGIIDGQAGGDITIEALDQHLLDLELGSEIVSSLSRLLSFVVGPENTLPYEIYGTVTVDRRLRQLPFSARGQVPLVTAAAR
jgi:hypothetical protein